MSVRVRVRVRVRVWVMFTFVAQFVVYLCNFRRFFCIRCALVFFVFVLATIYFIEHRLTLVSSHCSGRPTAVGRAGAAGAVFSYTLWTRLIRYYNSVIMRPSSLGGGRILRRTLSVCLSVRPVIERHVAPPSELQ